MTSAIRSRFFAYGYLMPTLVPLAAIGGRALADLLVVLYLVWAGIACWGVRPRGAALPLALYGVLLAALLVGVPGAEEPASAARAWVKFLLYSGVFYFTLVALRQPGGAAARLTRTLGWAGAALLALLWLLLPTQLGAGDLRYLLREDDLPLFAPFLLFLAAAIDDRRLRWATIGGVLLALLGYILLSHGRAALLGLLVALGLYFALVGRWRLRNVALSLSLLLVAAVGVSWGSFTRLADNGGGWLQALDGFTSNRTLLWRQAFRHPPENPWTGIGIGALKGHQSPALVISESETVSHFHNFLVDAWYENGWIGLAGLLLFLAAAVARAAAAWPSLDAARRERLALALASAAAIVAAATLSFSYASREFAIYLFLLLAMVHHLAGSVRGEMDGESEGR